MKEFLSNAWVVSIISGIIVFFLTNTIIMLQNRRKHKKQIRDANTMVLNRLRGYVVDNGLPQKEVINAVKSSTSREYSIKYDELLNIKELCEELITDIIGNIYISNDNKVKYIEMLLEYLKEKSNFQEDIIKNKQVENNDIRKKRKINSYMEMSISIIPAVLAFIGVFISSLDTTEIELDKSTDIYSTLIEVFSIIGLSIMFIFILPELKYIIKWLKRKIK